MSPLARLTDVDWASVSHAYGPATDVPDLLRALQDPQAAAGALEALDTCILHQGTYYPATTASLPFLGALTCDPRTPDRPSLLVFVASIGAMIPGLGGDDVRGLRGRYLEPGIDLDAFERDAHGAFAATCTALLPCLEDADAGVRAAVADVWRGLAPLPADIADALRRRLVLETDAQATGAISGALIDAGLLTEAERATLTDAPPAAQFAAACIGLQSARPLDLRDLAMVRAHWFACAPTFSKGCGYRGLFDALLVRHKGAILPLVDDLAASGDLAWSTEAVIVYRDLARLSRSAAEAAVAGLLRLADGGTADTRARLADIFRELIALDPRDHGTRIADALHGLAIADPAERGARAAATLQEAGDERWLDVLEAAIAAGAPIGEAIPLLLAGARDDGDADAMTAALDLLRERMRRDPADGASRLWMLFDLPEEQARRLAPEVIACLPFAPVPASNLLARWRAPEAVAPIRAALADIAPEDRDSLFAGLAEITGDVGELDRGCGDRPDLVSWDVLTRWAAMPSATLYAVCRAKLADAPAVAFAARDLELVAARALLPVDGVPAIWPALRAIIDMGDHRMHDAVAMAVSGLEERSDPSARDALTALLEDIRANGRRGLLGKEADAPVEAALGLHALGAGVPAQLADTCMTALRIAPRVWLRPITPGLACDLLVALARDHDDLRLPARTCLAEALAGDARVAWRGSGNRIATDEAFQATLRRAAMALG